MTQLETDLRSWMHERAARVHASPELTRGRLSTRARPACRPRLAIGGGLAAAAGTIAAVLSLAGGASSAFAGWTARPTAPTSGAARCRQGLLRPERADPGLPLKLTDARGPFTFLVYSNDSSNDFCTAGPSFQQRSGWSTSPR